MVMKLSEDSQMFCETVRLVVIVRGCRNHSTGDLLETSPGPAWHDLACYLCIDILATCSVQRASFYFCVLSIDTTNLVICKLFFSIAETHPSVENSVYLCPTLQVHLPQGTQQQAVCACEPL